MKLSISLNHHMNQMQNHGCCGSSGGDAGKGIGDHIDGMRSKRDSGHCCGADKYNDAKHERGSCHVKSGQEMSSQMLQQLLQMLEETNEQKKDYKQQDFGCKKVAA